MNPAEEYILKQAEPYKSILLQLQAIVEAVVPDCEMLYKWRIPFFYSNGIPICFLNQSKDYVDLAFWHFKHMEQYTEYFVDAKRKSIRSLRYKCVEDINDEVVVYVLKKQLEINTNPFKLILKPKRK
ncbi:DUF1801 domain-containing protein [Jejuia pallidilutea]|uniref:YdhG-like domain-containing protein n=1 Tax=Jejuia pallidilutea TaxID=504487 RepID=A0A090VN79_9FLAO|nr:DUF1801 domain-containing protein [Jejuia pallidilutea]GAL66235.1 hypothetical protein JCM19301_800 [Jejuia pallidilutea]GAL71200.1 hypothetical protein JCM19302_629 [Jejuia pallidilutea]GAL88258.1 hypothetical protein JCM19538_2621 [Jejuia pallidilutea]